MTLKQRFARAQELALEVHEHVQTAALYSHLGGPVNAVAEARNIESARRLTQQLERILEALLAEMEG